MASAAASVEALQRAKFLFDLNGFLRLRAVLSRDEVAAANAAVSAHAFSERAGAVRNAQDGTPFVAAQGHRGRLDMGGMLGWAPPHREVFRSMLW
jgi:hypothetical protein